MINDDYALNFGTVALPKRRPNKKKDTAPTATLCPVCNRSSAVHSMIERRACARGVDARDDQ